MKIKPLPKGKKDKLPWWLKGDIKKPRGRLPQLNKHNRPIKSELIVLAEKSGELPNRGLFSPSHS